MTLKKMAGTELSLFSRQPIHQRDKTSGEKRTNGQATDDDIDQSSLQVCTDTKIYSK
jgi:hypothetical protein